jgi:hypothetical protein
LYSQQMGTAFTPKAITLYTTCLLLTGRIRCRPFIGTVWLLDKCAVFLPLSAIAHPGKDFLLAD